MTVSPHFFLGSCITTMFAKWFLLLSLLQCVFMLHFGLVQLNPLLSAVKKQTVVKYCCFKLREAWMCMYWFVGCWLLEQRKFKLHCESTLETILCASKFTKSITNWITQLRNDIGRIDRAKERDRWSLTVIALDK